MNKNIKKKYIIGTRGSLLAVTQSTQMKRRLEQMTGDEFELKLIETEGDQISNVPLWQLEGKDFFTKELDAALLQGRVDLVVHSYKDLGSVRPAGITLAAITARYPAHDILLIKKETIPQLKKIKTLVVGTSAPRRITNLSSSLTSFLPLGENSDCLLEIKTLRGNVNTRINKLLKNEYHAIVLAYAGLERLAQFAEHDQKVASELNELLSSLDFMILPPGHFPSAASQGALAIECAKERNDEDELLNKIKNLHCQTTAEEVGRERTAFHTYGGGCHLAVGIQCKKIGPYFWHIHRGEHNHQKIQKNFLERPSEKQLPTWTEGNGPLSHEIFLGLPSSKNKTTSDLIDRYSQKNSKSFELKNTQGHVLFSVDYALNGWDQGTLSPHTILWAPGAQTMKKMAQKGLWPNGHLEGSGERGLSTWMQSSLMKFWEKNREINGQHYTLVSHNNAQLVFPQMGTLLATYNRQWIFPTTPSSEEQIFYERLSKARICYWTSFSQYQHYIKFCPDLKKAWHCCGLGKVLEQFEAAGIEVYPFATMDEFYHWTNL